MYKTKSFGGKVVIVLDPKAPKHQHIILNSGWQDQLHLISENGILETHVHELVTLEQIESYFGLSTRVDVQKVLLPPKPTPIPKKKPEPKPKASSTTRKRKSGPGATPEAT